MYNEFSPVFYNNNFFRGLILSTVIVRGCANEICERRSRSRQILWNASWNFVRSLFALFCQVKDELEFRNQNDGFVGGPFFLRPFF
jgi:hypothetical protein